MKKFPEENGYFTHEDPTCYVLCECGFDIREIVSDHKMVRCPQCGRGYKTEFVVWQFEPDEKDEGAER